MPRELIDLPPAFRTEHAIAEGLTHRDLREMGCTNPTQGLTLSVQPEDCEAWARALALVLEEPFAFSHTTAARLWDVPLPTEWTMSERVDVLRPLSSSHPGRRCVAWHVNLAAQEVVTLRGLPVTSPAWTCLGLAGTKGFRVADLVAVGDAFLNREGADDFLVALELLSSRRRVRGAARMREAISLMRPGSRSRMETLTRLRLLEGGLPEPELNAAVVVDGEWLATVDFLWRDAKVIVEYEGDQHRTDREQWHRDIARVRALEAAGYRIIRVTIDDHARPLAFLDIIARVAELLRAAA